MRYVHYYEHVLRYGPRPAPLYQVTHVRMSRVPDLKASGGCEPFFKIAFEGRTKIYDYRHHVQKIKR